MKLIPTTTDSIALLCVTLVTLSIFIAGLCDVLNYFIVKAILFLCFGSLFACAIYYALKNDIKKNRPEDTSQDDSH